MWDYDTRKVGGGGGAEERWDVLPGRRGEDEKERRGGGWGRGGGAGGAKNAAPQRSELKAEERRKCRLANSRQESARLNASLLLLRLLRGSEDRSPRLWSVFCQSCVLGRQLPGCGGRRWTLLQVSGLRRIPARSAALGTRTRRARFLRSWSLLLRGSWSSPACFALRRTSIMPSEDCLHLI